jgi:hypothetical protein
MDIFTALWPIYSIVRAILILLDVALLFLFILAAVELFLLRPHFVWDPRRPAEHRGAPGHKQPATVGTAWKIIREKIKAGTPDVIRISIIEADGLVDTALKKRGYEGDTFADRLSKLHPQQFDSVNDAWDAHRLRNDIVHTPGFEVSLSRAEKALDHYETFLKELGALSSDDIAAAHGAPVSRHSPMVDVAPGAPPKGN